MKKLNIYLSLLMFSIASYAKMTVGVTMLPYYSFVSNIVGDKMNVVSIVPENINSHNYDPTFNDLKKLRNIDVLVVNGIGHDEYYKKMIKSVNNSKIKIINANENVSLMISGGTKNINEINSHTFISVSKSIEQINWIAKKLGEIDPENRQIYMKNSVDYNRKLRKILFATKRKLRGLDLNNIKIATTHAGYDYLLADFGLTVSVVIEPSVVHSPSATDLANAIDKIKNDKIKILFDENTSNHKNAMIINKETGVFVATLDHLTNGPYSREHFEKYIQKDLDSVINALIKVNKMK